MFWNNIYIYIFIINNKILLFLKYYLIVLLLIVGFSIYKFPKA